MVTPEYYTKLLDQSNPRVLVIQISKFLGTSEPAAVYEVTQWPDGKLTCNCPAGSHGRRCKHLIMASNKIAALNAEQYDEDEDDETDDDAE